ncbi:WD repeat-containing protein 63 [Acipenser oxyrinchus oxyrinchus]|uniref:WD repeat-containing protein 63 n=1 Tax=Acipenser oxyrinchus oxyrinchus TaxID=40147 RepID=A0AAD8DAA7_ACIOX|nr:WD repeat-containing protein 63 [Acipenser oxyrinchus oxyrinchus]
MSDKPNKKNTSGKDATKRRKSTNSATSSQRSFKGKTKTTTAKKEDTPTTPTGSATESGPPDDIFPLVLTSKTQELFQCRADEDLTQENLHKIIKKEEILNDMKMRAAVSDFYPVKQMVMNYPGEELLLVFDRDFKYGQSFYLVGTEDTKERILHPPEPSEEEGVEEEDLMETFVYKTPEPKPWESLGSDLDIEEESVKDSRCKHRYKISRKRREFGAPVMFTDRNASVARDGYIECTSYPDKSFCVTKMEIDTGIQAVPQLQETSTQTKWKYPRNACTQYVPREFTDEEKENFMNSQSLKDFINSVALRFEIAVQQNEIMDAFFDDWKALGEDESTFGGKTDTHLKEYQSFTDLYYSKDKAVSYINWHPAIYGIIAVAVSERLSFEDRINLSAKLVMTPSLILIWSFSDPIHPQLLMECPDDICCFEFCPSDPNIIVGGCINGQVVLWDISAYAERLQSTRTGGAKHTPAAVNALPGFEEKNVKKTPIVRYCAVSSIEHGHKAPISDVQWLPDYYEISRQGIPLENKNGICVQIITCAPDCSVYFWDIRPPNTATQAMTDRKKSEEKHLENPQGIPNTFKHLDLTWKPLIRVGLPRIETSGEYSALKVSLKDILQEGRLHGITDKSRAAKLEKTDGGFDYGMLRVPSAKNLKTQEDISTTFFVGTEDGDLVYSDFKMEKDSDSGKLTSSKPSHCFVIHDGLVTTVKRSPFFKDIVLTVGGWTFAIWKEGVMNGPILQSSASQKKCTVGHWSLSRPGVFFIGKEDGNIDIWDLLEKTHEPSQTQNISTGQITCIKPWIVSSKQHLLAVSDEFGTLHILEIPWTLRHPSSNEKLSVTNYFEREVKHLNYSEKRREFREQEKRDMDAEELRRLSEIVHEKTAEQLEEEVQQEFREYLKLEKHILSDMGLIKPAEDTPLPGV